jgi:hypothetical protein
LAHRKDAIGLAVGISPDNCVQAAMLQR